MQIAQVLRRLHARRSRQSAARHGQEESRGDGRGEGALPRRARSANGRAGTPRGRDLRPDGDVRGVRLQQVALRRLRADLVPDRLSQGALPAEFLAGAADAWRWATPTRRTRTSPSRAATASACCRRTSTRAATTSPCAPKASASASVRPRASARRRSRRSSRRGDDGPFRSLGDFCARTCADRR